MATEPDNMNREWELEINVSGINAPVGKGGAPLPEGYFKAKVEDAYINPEKPNRVIFKLKIAEGPFTGTIRTSGLGKPTSAEDKVRYFWRGLAESVGYTPAQLDAGGLTISSKSFVGRVAHIFYRPADEAAGRQYEDISFLAPGEWAQQKQGFEVRTESKTNGAPTLGGNTITPASGSPANSGTDKASIMAKLGLQ